MMMTELTEQSYGPFLRTSRFVAVHFWAEWNSSYDSQLDAILGKLPSELLDRISFARLNVDPPNHHRICQELHIMNLPFLALYRDACLVKGVLGVRVAEEMMIILQDLISE